MTENTTTRNTTSGTNNSSATSSTKGGYKGNMTSKEAGDIVKNALREQERLMSEASGKSMK